MHISCRLMLSGFCQSTGLRVSASKADGMSGNVSQSARGRKCLVEAGADVSGVPSLGDRHTSWSQ